MTQWTVKQIAATAMAILVGVPTVADAFTGFKTLGDLQPFALKWQVSDQLDAVSKSVADVLASLNEARWDQATDRADKWQQDLITLKIQEAAFVDRLKAKPGDTLLLQAVLTIREQIADKERRLVALQCDLQRRTDKSRSC